MKFELAINRKTAKAPRELGQRCTSRQFDLEQRGLRTFLRLEREEEGVTVPHPVPWTLVRREDTPIRGIPR